MAAAFPSRAIALASLLALAACTDVPAEPAGAATQAPDTAVSNIPVPQPAANPGNPRLVSPVGPARPSDCNAPKAAPFIGRQADPATRADLSAAVAPVSAIRWVGPGDATTEDYSPQRLNVMLDVGGVIRSVHCG